MTPIWISMMFRAAPPPFSNAPGLGCIQDTSSSNIGSYAVRSVEAGWREQWHGSLLTELSLYRDDEKDRIDYSSGQRASPAYSGVEAELQWQAAPPWRLYLTAGYHDAEGDALFSREELIGTAGSRRAVCISYRIACHGMSWSITIRRNCCGTPTPGWT